MKSLKKIWLFVFKSYLRLGLFFYYKKIKVFNADNIPKNESVLILSNHQNALLDALLIGTQSPRFVYFLTRASVFKKPLVKKFLSSLQMLPVYRIRDGWGNLPKNAEIFNTCSKLLSDKEAVVIFPEGSHNLKRTVRPLSKGFTRIVFDTLMKNPSLELKLLPVGLNFEDAKSFKDSVSIYFGKPFLANDFLSKNLHESTANLKQDVQNKIRQLTTHIPLDDYDAIQKKLDDLNVNYLYPSEVNTCIANNLEGCTNNTSKQKLSWLTIFLKPLLILSLIGPYLAWKFYIQPKIKELEFTGTFRLAIALILVPFWLITLGIVFSCFFTWKIGLFFVLGVLILHLITVKI